MTSWNEDVSTTPHTGDSEKQGRAWIEGALWRSEAQSRALFASLRDATIVIDDHGTIQAASDSVRRVFQYEPPELIGRNIKLLMPEPHHSNHDAYLSLIHI